MAHWQDDVILVLVMLARFLEVPEREGEFKNRDALPDWPFV